MWRRSDSDRGGLRLADRVEQVEFAGALGDDQADLAIRGERRQVWRHADRDLADYLVARGVEYLHGIRARHGEVDPAAVRAKAERARRLVERDGPGLGHAGQVDGDQRRLALLLRTDVGA